LRILQIIQRPQLRGAETFACQLSQHLIQLGNQVDVLFLFGEEQLKMPFDLPFIYLKANEKIRWLDIASFRKLAKIINAGNYDIVQANAGDTLKYASLSRKIFKWKSKLVYRNANKLSDFLTSPIKKLVNQWLVNEIDFVASVSNECRLDFEKTFNFSSDRLLTLPIGVNDSISKSYSSLADIKIYGTGPFFLSVASFVSEKNHKGLIQIFSFLLKKCPTSKLLLVGEGNLKSDIKKVVSELDLSESVYFLGNRNDVLGIMPLCKALLLPSLIEGLPAVIIEAFISNGFRDRIYWPHNSMRDQTPFLMII